MKSLEDPKSSGTTDAAVTNSKRFIIELTEGYTEPVNIRFWDGSMWEPVAGVSRFTVVLNHPGSIRAMFWPFSKLSMGESYIFGDFDIEGDILAFIAWLRFLLIKADKRGLWSKLKLLSTILKLPKQHNTRNLAHAGNPTKGDHRISRETEAIQYTYDLPGEIYRLFLGDNMQYTCAYFSSAEEKVEVAQHRKMDYICRKLRLQPGQKLLDIGCGWGALLVHAAKTYGVEAVGVTLSQEQADWANRAITEGGLKDRVKIVLCDYREFNQPGMFDKACSVGLGEHIGNRNLPIFMAKVFESLRPGGAYLHHSITLRPNTPFPRWTAFARKYVFPNGELQTILRVLESAASAGFEIRDVENLREHYVLTLEGWVRNLETHRDKILELSDEVRYRIFHLYMAGATMGFRNGTYGLYQNLLVKPEDGKSGLPFTRGDWYVE